MLKLGELATILRAETGPFEQGLREARSKFEQHGEQLRQGAMVAGAAIGAVMAAGIAGALELDAAKAKLAAQIGNPEYAQELGAIAGKLYTRGFGESAAQAMQSVRAVISSGLVPEDSSNEYIEEVTRAVQALGTAFDVDVTQASRAAGQMVRNGLAKNASEAMDIITRGFQQTGDMSGDLLDSMSEYSTQFRKLGLSGADAMGLMSQGVKAGARDLDVVADGLKEFAIRAADGSESSAAGFEAIGLNAEKMTAIFAAGGPKARDALGMVLSRIQAMTDPTEREAAAVALFGTKAEDLQGALMGMDLSSAAGQLGNVTGAAGKMADTLEQSASQKLEAFKRTAMESLSHTLAAAIPYLQSVTNFLTENSSIVGPLAVGLGALALVIGTVAAALKVWSIVQAVLNLALWTSPITWIVVAIIGLVLIIAVIATKTDWFQRLWGAAWGGIKSAASAVGNWFVNTLWKGWILGAWNGIISAGSKAVSWFQSIPGKIKNAFMGLASTISAPFRAAFNAVARFWNSTVGRLNFSMPGWVPGIGGKGFSMPRLPMLAKGGTALAPGMAIVGDKGPELAYMGRGATIQPLSRSGGGGGGTSVHRIRLEWPDGRLIREIIVDAASQRGQSTGQFLKVA